MKQYQRTKTGCYMTNVTMSVTAGLSPLLFLTFREQYGISFTLLGLLVLINFCTQLIIDLIFSFYSHRFNIPLVVKCTPLIAAVGLLLYTLLPMAFPDYAYAGIVIGTIVFSASSGLAEVLISPVIAAIPSDNPDREMSKLHSAYAWGVVVVVLFSTVFLNFFGDANWHFLALLLALIPITASVLMMTSSIPPMETPHEGVAGVVKLIKNPRFFIYMLCIFFGGASEVSMAQWSSSFLEQSLGLPKVLGDIFGVAAFSVMLGLGRTFYAKFGKNIDRVLILGSAGTVVCYLVAALSGNAIVGLIFCAFTGFCTSMLWPGSLIISSARFPKEGVALFALMAAGGDLGASVGPQLVGVITDTIIALPGAVETATLLGLSIDQLSIKLGVLSAIIFPIGAVLTFMIAHRNHKKWDTQAPALDS